MATPTVFISYSHDSEAHKAWVAALAARLQEKGVRVTFDQWDLILGADVVAFVEQGVASADRVLMICTARYVTKADSGVGGVGYERLIVSGEIYQRIETTKFIPVIRDNPDAKTPAFMGARLYVDLSKDSQFDAKFDELLKAIYGMPAVARPPLGPSPFSSVAPAEAPVSASSASELHVQDTSWSDQQASSAMSGLTKLARTAGMEVRLQLTGTEQWSQLELYEAVKKAEIRTFGWPIGIVLEGRDEYKPRPRN